MQPAVPALVLAPGPRAAEAALFARLAAASAAARADPSLFAEPVRVLVPSGAVREHLARRLAAQEGAALGILVQSLDGLARELLERAGTGDRRREALLDVLVRRAARAEATLAAALGARADGPDPLTGSVRDLLDAGLDEDTRAAFEEALESAPLAPARRRRVLAVARVAEAVRAKAEAGGFWLASEPYARAARALAEHGPLPTRALFVYGFVDTTGRAAELLDALARAVPTTFLLDRPPAPHVACERPEEPLDSEREARFADRLRDRWIGLDANVVAAEPAPPTRIAEVLRAPGRSAEVRAVAERCHALIAAGVAPESIAIVARDLEPYRLALAVQLERAGLSWSCTRVRAHADRATARLSALAALLDGAERALLDRWLDAQAADLLPAAEDGSGGGAELRLALRVLGLTRLQDLAEIDLDLALAGRAALALPVHRLGVEPAQEGDESTDEEGAAFDEEPDSDLLLPTSSRARVSAERLDAARRSARAWLEVLAARPAEAETHLHADALLRGVRTVLGWRAEESAWKRLEAALESLSAGTAGCALDAAEFTRALAHALRAHDRLPLKPEGGGVRVLDAMEARARTWTHLFWIGLEKDAFPRAGVEDPLVPDAARTALSAVLPDLAPKARRHEEERFLFASLLASAEAVTLSWPALEDDGLERVVSPALARLVGGEDGVRLHEVLPARPEHAFPEGALPARTGAELATLAFVHGLASERERAWIAALAEAGAPAERRAALAAHKLAVLDEVEGRGERFARLGPFLGLVGALGPGSGREDPGAGESSITTFERYATCPWQVYLQRVLELERLPDPVAALPTIDALQVGRCAHRALEAIALGRFPEPRATRPRLAEALANAGAPAHWPASESALDALVAEAARRELEESGFVLPGLLQALAARAAPLVRAARKRLDRAHASDPGGAARRVLGAEVEGEVRIALEDETPFRLRFRADRVDRVRARGEDGVEGERLELIDYKTGRPFVDQKTEKGRANAILKAIRRGRHLQGIAYALGAETPGALGRYVFLDETLEEHAFSADLGAELGEPAGAQAEAFREAIGPLFAGWRAGVFFPRLFEPNKGTSRDENAACRRCEVREACVRGDSGARRREHAWESADGAEERGAVAVARSLWQLGVQE